jgi:hypothetical protein
MAILEIEKGQKPAKAILDENRVCNKTKVNQDWKEKNGRASTKAA